MQLRQLIQLLPTSVTGLPDVDVTAVREDSRLVTPGALFVARQGLGVDGKRFVAAAVAKGAVAVLADAPVDDAAGLPVVVVPDAGRYTGVLAQAVAGSPSRDLRVMGVTGTNGKTTVAYLLRHLSGRAGAKCGLIGTCAIDDGKAETVANMTTPAPDKLAELMATMRDNGCLTAAMEVSSHALDQGRAGGVAFAAAGFTNLTGDHLDYHGTMEAYADAKARLFRDLAPGTVAAVNGHDPWSDRMVRETRASVVRFGVGGERGSLDYHVADLEASAEGTRFTLTTPRGTADVSIGLVGRHNVENVLCAAAMAGETFALSAADLAGFLADAPAAPGRLQRVEHASGDFAVFVDYAHTDDALDNVLRALRPVTRGRLKVVFGCGGDRDKTKRPRMAAAAERLADDVIVTSDNPRTEDPIAIIDDVLNGLTRRGDAVVEVDRRRAIVRALGEAAAGDVVLIAGKGHEDYQIIGTTRHDFDDVVECQRALASAAA